MFVLQCDNRDILQHIMKIAICKRDSQEYFSIILEGWQVMAGLENLTRACAALIGLKYAVNHTYPKELRHADMFLCNKMMFLNNMEKVHYVFIIITFTV